jgi:hypothetical protein
MKQEAQLRSSIWSGVEGAGLPKRVEEGRRRQTVVSHEVHDAEESGHVVLNGVQQQDVTEN